MGLRLMDKKSRLKKQEPGTKVTEVVGVGRGGYRGRGGRGGGFRGGRGDGRGRGRGRGGFGGGSRECYNCNKERHIARECPDGDRRGDR